jgi:hypothetical protein
MRHTSSVAKLSSADLTSNELLIISIAALMSTPARRSLISIPQAKAESMRALPPLPMPSERIMYAKPFLSMKLSK